MSDARPGDSPADSPSPAPVANSTPHCLWTRSEVAQLVDQERAQIGHDLHDDLIPLLFAARSRAEVLAAQFRDHASSSSTSTAEAAASLAQIAQWLGDAMHWGRRLLGSIHTHDFSIRTWQEAVQDQVTDICRQVELVWQLDRASLRVDNDLATVVYRITVESIRNAVRHGKAKRIVVASTVDQERYRLTITDDGIGFDPSAVDGEHYGLQIMRSRAELVGGKLSVDSSPGNSASVELVVPMVTTGLADSSL